MSQKDDKCSQEDKKNYFYSNELPNHFAYLKSFEIQSLGLFSFAFSNGCIYFICNCA